MGLFGGIASAVGSIAGGLMGLQSSRESQANANQLNQLNYEHQKEFAQNGIRWKVADAKAAGLHPLAALGTQTAMYTPSASVGDSADYSFLADAGQGIGRAIDAKQTRAERIHNQQIQDKLTAQQIESRDLDMEYKRTLIQAQKQDMVLRLAKSAEQALRTQQQVPALPGYSDSPVIRGQAEAYANGATNEKISDVVTSMPGDPTTQAGTPPDSRGYLSPSGRVLLPNEDVADAVDAVPGAGLQYAWRNSVVPYLANFLPIDDPRRRKGEYFDLLSGAYRKGGRFRDWFGY